MAGDDGAVGVDEPVHLAVLLAVSSPGRWRPCVASVSVVAAIRRAPWTLRTWYRAFTSMRRVVRFLRKPGVRVGGERRRAEVEDAEHLAVDQVGRFCSGRRCPFDDLQPEQRRARPVSLDREQIRVPAPDVDRSRLAPVVGFTTRRSGLAPVPRIVATPLRTWSISVVPEVPNAGVAATIWAKTWASNAVKTWYRPSSSRNCSSSRRSRGWRWARRRSSPRTATGPR